MSGLTHLSENTLQWLRDNLHRHAGRYAGDGFVDLAGEPGWSIGVPVDFDPRDFRGLDGSVRSSAADYENSLIIWEALQRLSPSLANEERIWTRLSHIECFEYSRDRWIDPAGSDEDIVKMALLHFFAPGRTGIRDDHSISRLWWNGYISSQYWPQDFARGVELLLLSADVRSSIVERPWISARKRLAKGIFRSLDRDTSLGRNESRFRSFMKKVNLHGAGVVFEAMSEKDIDSFLDHCDKHSAGEADADV